MASQNYPAPGTFFKPVGLYSYFLEVVEINLTLGGRTHWVTYWTMRRWGMSDDRQQPVDDGHISLCHEDLIPIGNGKVLKSRGWKRADTSGYYEHSPKYYRQIGFKGQQQALF
jgi:hypothetical protein